MKKLTGKCGAPGYSIGHAYFLKELKEIERTPVNDVSVEMDRFNRCVSSILNSFSSQMETADTLTKDIYDVQISILTDMLYVDRILNYIKEEVVLAEYAVKEVGLALADEIEGLDSEYLSERSSDIRGITQRLIDELTEANNYSDIPKNSIIVADELTPQFLLSIDKSNVCGIISKNGSKTSHAAILCGNYCIPYLYGIDIKEIEAGSELAIDMSEQVVYINPDDTVKEKILSLIDENMKPENISIDTKNIRIMANISSKDDLVYVNKYNADGVGLYRTECLFMGEKLPTEDEQFLDYKAIAEELAGKELIIRTVDLGADKQSPCVNLPTETNPALGKRGIRICLEDTELFRTQLKAIMRAACFGNISIMYPMITSVKELEQINEQIKLASEELMNDGIDFKVPSQGIMIETPAAAMLSDILADYVDFFSIGTNDLTQYVLASDRLLGDNYDVNSEAIMRFIELVVNNAHKKGVKVGICGELAGDLNYIERLCRIGVDELSMSANKINPARKIVCEI